MKPMTITCTHIVYDGVRRLKAVPFNDGTLDYVCEKCYAEITNGDVIGTLPLENMVCLTKEKLVKGIK